MGDLANITAARDQTFIDRLRLTCRPLLLPIFCLAQLLDAVNLSGANVALPRIQEDLGFSVGTLQVRRIIRRVREQFLLNTLCLCTYSG